MPSLTGRLPTVKRESVFGSLDAGSRGKKAEANNAKTDTAHHRSNETEDQRPRELEMTFA